MTEPGLAARLDAWRDRRRHPRLAFVLDGRTYRIPDHPARVWVLAILSDEAADLLLDVLPKAVAEELWEDALDEETDVDVGLLARIGKTMLTKAAGRPWWQANQLVATLVAQWADFDGHAADRGLGDPLDWPLERLCNWIYLRLVVNAKPEEREQIDADLAAPPIPDDDDGDPDSWEDEGSTWAMAAAQAQQVGLRA